MEEALAVCGAVDLQEAVDLREAVWEDLLGEEEWEALRAAEEVEWADLRKAAECRSFMPLSAGKVQLRSELRARWNQRRITITGSASAAFLWRLGAGEMAIVPRNCSRVWPP